jgi:uncharacterized membrane protein
MSQDVRKLRCRFAQGPLYIPFLFFCSNLFAGKRNIFLYIFLCVFFIISVCIVLHLYNPFLFLKLIILEKRKKVLHNRVYLYEFIERLL